MSRRTGPIALIVAMILASSLAFAQDWPRIDRPADGVTLVYDDYGAWGGGSMGTSHQVRPDYRVRKYLDLSDVPQRVFDRAKQARLLIYFAAQDYSWNSPDIEHNGLDETFEIVVNDNVYHHRTADIPGARENRDDPMDWEWHQFDVPLRHLERGPNTIEIRKSERDEPPYEDYIYVGIDNTESHGHSAYREGEQDWTDKKLNAIDAAGEYMIRLLFLETEPTTTTTWRPGEDAVDPLGFVGSTSTPRKKMIRLRDDDYLKMEFDPEAFDAARQMKITVESIGAAPRISVADGDGEVLDLPITPAGYSFTLQVPPDSNPDVLYIGAAEVADSFIQSVTFEYATGFSLDPPPVNMSPKASKPVGGRIGRANRCLIDGNTIVLQDGLMKCSFTTNPTLRMTSFHNQWIEDEMLRDPGSNHLFLLEIDGERFGAEDFDFEVASYTDDGRGFVASLLLAEHDIRATLEIGLADHGQLEMYLALANAGDAPVTFKTAFPHLGGLAVSDNPKNDYYMFPAWGGIIASANTQLRTAYGENTAWWRMIDLYSPARGGGVAMRSLDDTGLYKCPVLRKGVRLVPEYVMTDVGRYMEPEMYWQSSLDPGDGTSMAFEYLRRTREPGEGFTPPAALVEVHPGDWHEAMDRYARWAHDVWEWRPHPSALAGEWNIIATGWGQSPLYGENGWRTELFQEGRDILEMMSWWEWSEVGPWHVPMDQLQQTLGEAFYERYKSYWVINPATGKLEYPLNRGDYAYNQDWGGLPALRSYIQQHKDAGHMPMFYMEGILCCDTTETGRQFGEQYGVMNDLWTDAYNTGQTPEGYVGSYASWNMCSDTHWWPDYLAETVARVCRDTGIAGVRLDEYGHRGYVCNSDRHEHIFAEPGHNAWLQAVSRACGLVHDAMDEVDPDLVLTTEFPGHDHMARQIDGCIVYESMSHVRPIRPVPVNLFRFYFPECKVYDLDRGEGDWLDWQLFNGMARFGGEQPANYYRIFNESTELFDGRDLTPLVPTLRDHVYANRFDGRDKRITTLYNDGEFTVDGMLLPVEREDGWHWFDLLTCQELDPHRAGGGWAVGRELGPGDVACIARLPERLSVERGLTGYRVEVSGDLAGMKVQICDLEGAVLAEQDAAASAELVLPGDPDADPECVKLKRFGRLIDVVEMP
ncbi:MAG: hypothetical protein GF393_07730 [Armatimonadia bacterium]|nr:hypothetical protein [Armatimonadia bacterium]